MTVMTTPSTTLYPARRGTRTLTAEDLWAIPRVGAPTPAPDGASVAVSVTTYDLEKNVGRGRIWLVPLRGGNEKGPAGNPRPLTSPDVSSLEPVFSPDGSRLAFVRKGDDGKGQLHVMPVDGGESEKLTDLPLGVYDPKWLPDGAGLVFVSPLIKGHWTPEATRTEVERRLKDPVKAHVTEDRVFRFWDNWLTTGEVPHLFAIDLASRAVRDLTPRAELWLDWMEPSGQYAISPDGREVTFAGIRFESERSLLRSAIFVAPTTGEPAVTCLTADHPADDVRPRYTPDGRAIVYGMQQDPYFYADRVRLMRFDRATGRHEPWLDDWTLSPTHWEFGPDGTLFVEVEDGGRVSLYTLQGKESPRERVRGGTVASVVPGHDGRVYFTLQTLSDAPELHVSLPVGGAPTRLTRFTESALANVSLGEVREIQFEGAYGETVQMYVVLPPGDQPGKRYPLVQVIHGGPHGITPDAFHFRWNAQLFASAGYVAALVNFQGSTSWGQDFAKRIQGAWGDRPFQDVMKATDLLIAQGLVDESRMAAAGGSYGGYLSAWIASHTDRFKCIVNHAGVYDTLSQYASDVTQGRAQSFGGEPWDGIEAIDRWNPARFASGMNTPMLVIHGERDYRVPAAQGLECYGMLKAKGVPARLVYFPDENHWVLKPRNSLLWYREVQGWLARWLAV
ncbi:MAG TPA: S9 family peptidase [Candidatus Limnocylindria bacterium]|nr:S9 family peptidase [Candidatus Limnocylindria bacterium]